MCIVVTAYRYANAELMVTVYETGRDATLAAELQRRAACLQGGTFVASCRCRCYETSFEARLRVETDFGPDVLDRCIDILDDPPRPVGLRA